jgi:hypothetical protein
MTTEAEDAQLLKDTIKALKLSTFDLLLQYARMTPAELHNAGHRNGNAQALLTTVEQFKKRQTKLNNDFFHKWPDC